MSYAPTTLIAREGYAGLGAMDRTTASTFCGQKFGVTSKDFQPCVNHYVSGKPGDYQSSSTATASTGTLATIGGITKDLLGGMLNSFAAAKGGAGQQPVVVAGGTPSWLMPVAIGGLGLFALLMLRRRRGGGGNGSSAPRSNPARRRRRRNVHRRR